VRDQTQRLHYRRKEVEQTMDTPLSLELTTEELALIEAGLRLMLMAEDDAETIARLKTLLDRVQGRLAVRRR
jgi:hypothetical protein